MESRADSLAELVRQARTATNQGQFASAEALCRQIAALNPNEPSVPVMLGIGAAQSGRLPQSAELFEAALRLDPLSSETMNWLSAVYRHLGRLPESIAIAERAREANPQDYEALFNLGMGYLDVGRVQEAISVLQALLKIQPQLHPALFHLGTAYLRIGREDQAAKAFESAIAISPDWPPYHLSLGMARLSLQDLVGARKAADRALVLSPDAPPSLIFAAKLDMLEGNRDEAEKRLRKAISIDPQSDKAQSDLAYILHAAGRFDEARDLSRRSLEMNPNQGTAYYSLVQTQRCNEQDRELLNRMELLANSTGQPPTELLFLRYGLGKAHEDLGEFEVAMKHFDEANRIRYELDASQGEWSFASYTEFADKTIAQFSQQFFTSHEGYGVDSDLPIFVVGMIRSGTTLLEEMLSGHQTVAAGGEQQFWPSLGLQAASAFERQDVLQAAEKYSKLLRDLAPTASHVTDKMPGNYAYLGLIHLHFPNARIVHVRRHPIDTCLSIWTTYVGSMGFRNRRDHIVFAYRLYLRFMRHWRQVLPADRLLEIDYEDLVSSPEPTMRRALEFCGLNWDEACLHPEANDRFVETPSMWRVRQPVDSSSVARWRRYEPWLGEFRELVHEG